MTTKMEEKNDIIFELETENNEGKIVKEFKKADIPAIPNKVLIDFNTLKPTHIKDCGCNIGLKLINIGNINILDNDEDGLPPFYRDRKSGTTPDLYIQLGNNGDKFYKVLNVMPNKTANSPDVIDPPPSRPGGSSSVDKWAEVSVTPDPYVAVNPNWLKGLPNRNASYPVVAVMDTGIDMRFFTDSVGNTNFPLHYYQNNPCDIAPNYPININGLFGWSFIKDDPNPEHPFDNDNRHKHGTRIARIIANVTDNKVRIMSLKTADHTGESTFFAIFCAFEYILSYNKKCVDNNLDKDKVKLINASWGYYGDSYDMFKSYIGKLGSNGEAIKFVNAAGNAGDVGNDNIEIGTSPTTNRYPTMYAPDFEHVYTVTTLDWSEDNDAVENYSSKYVEIGVRGRTAYIPKSKKRQNLNWFERITNSFRNLFNPLTPPNEGENIFGTFPDPLQPSVYNYIKGSSYATAYITGYMASRTTFDYDRRATENITQDEVVNSIVVNIANNNTLSVEILT
jgi:hypothetical protein